ncbi:class IV adenylate cyclase [Nonomuraea rhizosphaerae]|uniref:class IV adenylate cyclase n=1 Tax=Nonomuraea rhizosphaerae TaxID=2665663 RepID=UPI001C5F57CE|nr:class IV adenylate cyclase [Nonomuraea rhizosphaerae]
MPIEAELKARVHDPVKVRQALRERAMPEECRYADTYYDSPARPLTSSDRELRVRTVTTARQIRTILTYKAPAIHQPTRSKPETETEAADPKALDTILRALGYEPVISYEKHCTNWSYRTSGRRLLASLVTVPELDGTWLEIETLVDDAADLAGALEVIRAEMFSLGIEEHDLTTELYTEAVARSRAG